MRLYGSRPPQRLGTTVGMHRFAWDLHLQPLGPLGDGLPMAAVGHETVPSPGTPMAPPGVYPEALWANAIGAPELVAQLQGHTTLETAIERAIIASRQYAKAQRSFFRGRMRDWHWVETAT